MKIELEPTEENITKTLENDLLKRNKSVINFTKLIYSLDSNYSISLDGEWGSGKTFFIKQCIKTINLINLEEFNLNILPNYMRLLKNSMNVENLKKQYTAVYYNAWEYDNHEDPLLTIIYNIIQQDEILKNKYDDNNDILWNKIKNIITCIKPSIGYTDANGNTFGITVEYKKNKKEIKENILTDKLKEDFNNLQDEMIIEKSNRKVIFIDELDRCNPKFAVKLFERIKHFFNDERFVFVFAVNSNELQYTINKFYGSNFNGMYYLQKFFDLQFEIPKLDIKEYMKIINNNIDPILLQNVVMEVIKEYNFSMRDCNRYITMIKLVNNYINKYNQGLTSDQVKSRLFDIIIFPILFGIKIKNKNQYILIVNGKNFQLFYDSIMNIKEASESMIHIFNNSTSVRPGDMDLKAYMIDIYNFLFDNKIKEYYKKMNNFILVESDYKKFHEMLSFINDKVQIEKMGGAEEYN